MRPAVQIEFDVVFDLHPPALEPPVCVVAECARQELGAGQHLEPVADPDHRLAAGDERGERLGERGAGGEVERHHAPGAERVAVREPAGHTDQGGLRQQLGTVGQLGREHDGGFGARQLECQGQIAVTVRARAGHHERRGAAHASPRVNVSTSCSSESGATPAIVSMESSLTVPSR